MKISKKSGIAISLLIGLAVALIIVLHQNPDPNADMQQELLKKAFVGIFRKGGHKLPPFLLE